MNVIALVGRLGKDPELAYSADGTPRAKFTLAVDRRGKDKATDWFDCVCFRQAAEFAGNYLGKGRLVSVKGEIHRREWTAQDGTKRASYEVVCDTVQGLDKPRDGAPAADINAEDPFGDGE